MKKSREDPGKSRRESGGGGLVRSSKMADSERKRRVSPEPPRRKREISSDSESSASDKSMSPETPPTKVYIYIQNTYCSHHSKVKHMCMHISVLPRMARVVVKL